MPVSPKKRAEVDHHKAHIYNMLLEDEMTASKVADNMGMDRAKVRHYLVDLHKSKHLILCDAPIGSSFQTQHSYKANPNNPFVAKSYDEYSAEYARMYQSTKSGKSEHEKMAEANPNLRVVRMLDRDPKDYHWPEIKKKPSYGIGSSFTLFDSY